MQKRLWTKLQDNYRSQKGAVDFGSFKKKWYQFFCFPEIFGPRG
jgi:hypothetical protein